MRVGGKTSAGRRRTLRALIAALSVAALGACSGVSTKNDPEAERIVKKVMQAEKEDPAKLPLGGKDVTGGEDVTAVAKMRLSISDGGERQDAAVDMAWRADADNELGILTYKVDMGMEELLTSVCTCSRQTAFTSSIANLTVNGSESHTGERNLSTPWKMRPCRQKLRTCWRT